MERCKLSSFWALVMNPWAVVAVCAQHDGAVITGRLDGVGGRFLSALGKVEAMGRYFCESAW